MRASLDELSAVGPANKVPEYDSEGKPRMGYLSYLTSCVLFKSGSHGYQLAQLENTDVTYGVLVEQVASGGPAQAAGLKGGTSTVDVSGSSYLIGGDIITAVNGTKLVNSDSLSTYLEEYTLPGQTLSLSIIRDGQQMTINLVLGTRPPPPSS